MTERRTLMAQAATVDHVLKRNHVPSHVSRTWSTARALRFELVADGAVQVQRVENLAGEIAVALGARDAHVWRRDESVCVEVPRSPETVRLLQLCDRLQRAPALTAALGLDSEGAPLLLRLPAPEVGNVLIAGITGAGKTALARTILTSLAIFNRPEQLQIVLVDPKARGFAHLRGMPHIIGELVSSVEDALECLQWLIREMERRTAQRDITPALVVAIDELADLVQTGGGKIEAMLTRLCEGGNAAGIHLIACAQKPTAELIGSAVKASFPIRLVGAVASREEARYATAINDSGAEQLEGKGDFLLVNAGGPLRFQAAWIGPKDLAHAIVLLNDAAHPAQWSRPAQPEVAAASITSRTTAASGAPWPADPFYTLAPLSERGFWRGLLERIAGVK